MQSELIYNPCCGQGIPRRELDDVADFLKKRGWTVNRRQTSRPGEATELARQAVLAGAKVVIAAGGDGTVSEVANGLIGSDAALGVLPIGTTNVWAIQMGIPALNPMLPNAQMVKLVSDLEARMARPLPGNYYRKVLLDAARVLVEGRTVAVDVGELRGRYFLMWVGIGLDAAIVRSITTKEKSSLGSWAYIMPGLETFMRYRSTDVTLTLESKKKRFNTALIVVSNIQLYGGVAAIGANASVTDGKLDVCIFKGSGFFTFVQHAVNALSRQVLKDPNLECYQCREVGVETASPLPVQVDGDTLAETPVGIRAMPAVLKAIIPLETPGNLFAA